MNEKIYLILIMDLRGKCRSTYSYDCLENILERCERLLNIDDVAEYVVASLGEHIRIERKKMKRDE